MKESENINDTFQLSAVDTVVDIRHKTLNVVLVWRWNEVRDGQTLRFIDRLRRQPDSATARYHDDATE